MSSALLVFLVHAEFPLPTLASDLLFRVLTTSVCSPESYWLIGQCKPQRIYISKVRSPKLSQSEWVEDTSCTAYLCSLRGLISCRIFHRLFFSCLFALTSLFCVVLGISNSQLHLK